MTASAPSTATVARLEQLVAQQAQQRAARLAIIDGDRRVDYQQFNADITRCAAFLKSSTAASARIAILARNCYEFVVLLYAIPAAGRIAVPLNTRLAAAEWREQLQRINASVVCGEPDLLAQLDGHDTVDATPLPIDAILDPWPVAMPVTTSARDDAGSLEDIAWILFTSGTTGRPKAVMLSHSNLLAGLRSADQGRPVQDGDCYLYPFPLFHIAAHNVLHQHRHGATVVLMPGFDSKALLALVAREQVTTVSLAPTMMSMLLDDQDFDPDLLQSLRSIGYGASAIDQSLLTRILGTLDCALSQGYGMTELAGSVAFLDHNQHLAALGEQPELLNAVGKVVTGVELQLRDDEGAVIAQAVDGRPVNLADSTPVATAQGEIWIRAEQVCSGFWDTENDADDQWLATGDVGRFDDAGNLYIVDRKKDIIISGGENVASREVEQQLAKLAGVQLCAVVGLPDPRWGEAVYAMVQARQALDAQALRERLRSQLAGFKVPKAIEFGTLPVNASGKIDKAAVRRILATRLGIDITRD